MRESDAGPAAVLWLSSRYANIELAEALLMQLCQERGVDADAEHWVGMALREGLSNAIRHGNRQDPGKRVLVTFGWDRETLTIEVGDEGEGFAPEEVVDPLAPENQLKTSGRGIFYIKTFMDEVAFSRGETGGTLLTMRKRLGTTPRTKGAASS